MINTPLRPYPNVLKISPYIGGDRYLPGVETPIKLSANENPLGPSPHAIAAYYSVAKNLHRYPDGQATNLRCTIGCHYGLDPTRILCGCGSDELLSLLARTYAGLGDEIIYSQHGFLLYPILAHSVGAVPIAVPEVDLHTDIDAILANITDRTRIVYLANPNNPTGTYIPQKEMARLRSQLSDSILLVIDAAYAEYVEAVDYSDGISLVEAGTSTVVTRTFSKIYGLSALRLGWAYGPAVVIDMLNRMRGPFNLSTPAQAAGCAAISDTTHIRKSRDHNTFWRTWLTKQLHTLGLTSTNSVANFVLVHFPDDPRYNAREADIFLRSCGLITRRMESYGLVHSLRISIGSNTDMYRLLEAVSDFVVR